MNDCLCIVNVLNIYNTIAVGSILFRLCEVNICYLPNGVCFRGFRSSMGTSCSNSYISRLGMCAR